MQCAGEARSIPTGLRGPMASSAPRPPLTAMALDAFPSRSDRETFAIARELARSDDERRTVDAFEARLVAIGEFEEATVEGIRANRLARGEKVPSAAAIQRVIDDYGDNPGLDPQISEHLRAQARPADTLRALAWAHTTTTAMRRTGLHHLHVDDRPLMVALMDAHVRFADALFAFIGDTAFRREAGLAAGRDARSMGGGAIFPVFDTAHAAVDIDGKALSRHFDRLDALAEAAGVTAPSAFLGFGGDDSEDWFDAGDGLRTLEALLAAIRPGNVKLKDKGALRGDLDALADALRAAQAGGARFHLEVDI